MMLDEKGTGVLEENAVDFAALLKASKAPLSVKQIKTNFITKEQFPLVVEPIDNNMSKKEFLEVLRHDNQFFKSNLLKHGALLFRNFPLSNVDDFSDVIENLNTGKGIQYIGGDSPRTFVKGHIYTSTEAPPSIKIPLHNELSFIKHYPKHIYFFCETPSPEGGATIIADSRKVFKSIDENVKQRFMQKELKYISRYYYKSWFMDFINSIQRGHKTWIDVFETDQKKKVEERCRENEFGLRWLKKDWMELSMQRPAFIKHAITNENVFFNQAHLYDYNPKFLGFWRYLGVKMFYCLKDTLVHEVHYEDGSTIPRQDLYHVLDALDANTVSFPWRKGDVLVLDNVLAMHGRSPFKGKRRVLTAMTR